MVQWKKGNSMECPHCKYTHGYTLDENVTGTEGDFYHSPVKLERPGDNYHGIDDTARLYGCPACFKTFIQD